MTPDSAKLLRSAGGVRQGSSLEALPTPVLVVDAVVMQRNIDRLAQYAAAHQLAVRPHTKTHKSQTLAQRQLDAGARGLTVAKAGEARVMAAVSDDLLLAYPALDAARCRHIAALAQQCDLKVAIDSAVAAEAIADAAQRAGTTVGILIDLDVGMGRTGLQTAAEAMALAQHVDGLRGLGVRGIFCYPGHVWAKRDEQAEPLQRVADKLEEALRLWQRHGLSAAIVSGGSTPTAYQSHLVKQYTEIRPGTYIFNDMNTVHGGYCTLEDCAARIICTVVSNAVPGQVVIDAGSKTLTTDRCIPALESGHGRIVEYPDAVIKALSEEHGQVDVRQCAKPPRLGERISVVPNHICPCVNLHDVVWLKHGDDALPEPIVVDARGQLS